MRPIITCTVCIVLVTIMYMPSNAQSVSGTLKDSVNHTAPAVPGDEIFYEAEITNTSGTDDATGVQYNDPLDPNTTIVPNSVRTSALARDDNYSFNTVTNAGNVLNQ